MTAVAKETQEIRNRNIRPLLFYGVIFSFFILLSVLHTPGEPYGILSLMPVCFTIVAAIATKRALEPLLGGVIAGILLAGPTNFFAQLGSSDRTDVAAGSSAEDDRVDIGGVALDGAGYIDEADIAGGKPGDDRDSGLR